MLAAVRAEVPVGAEDDDDLTGWLERARAGDRDAAERVFPGVYAELRRLASSRLRGGGATLETTALVHEAYLRLVRRDAPWESRGHFFAVAARAMRSVLVDHARQRAAAKRQGGRQAPLSDALAWFDAQAIDVLDLDVALDELAHHDPRKRTLVDLRFFAGLPTDRAAEVLGVSVATAERDWAFARAWLSRRLGAGLASP